MTLGVFQRALQRGLARIGEPSLLEGVSCGNVNIERDCDLFAGLMDQSNDNHVVKADVATIDIAFNPRTGNVLTHPDGTYRLMRLLEDNGYTRRFVLAASA